MYLLTFAVRIKRQKVRTAGILIIENSSLYVSVMPFVSSFVGVSSLFSFFKRATSVVVIRKTAPQKNRKSGGERNKQTNHIITNTSLSIENAVSLQKYKSNNQNWIKTLLIDPPRNNQEKQSTNTWLHAVADTAFPSVTVFARDPRQHSRSKAGHCPGVLCIINHSERVGGESNRNKNVEGSQISSPNENVEGSQIQSPKADQGGKTTLNSYRKGKKLLRKESFTSLQLIYCMFM